MRIQCGDHWHQVSPTGMAIIIDAFQNGDLTSTRTHSIRCMRYAFTAERVRRFMRLYKGNNILFDWKVLNGSSPARQTPRTSPHPVHQPEA